MEILKRKTIQEILKNKIIKAQIEIIPKNNKGANEICVHKELYDNQKQKEQV